MSAPEIHPSIELDRRHTEFGSELELLLPLPTRDIQGYCAKIIEDASVIMAKLGYLEKQSARTATRLYPHSNDISPDYRALLPHPYDMVQHEATVVHGFLGKQVMTARIHLMNPFNEGKALIAVDTDRSGETTYSLTSTPGKSYKVPQSEKGSQPLDQGLAEKLVEEIASQTRKVQPADGIAPLSPLASQRLTDVFTISGGEDNRMVQALDELTIASSAMMVTRTGTYPTLQGPFGSAQLRITQQESTAPSTPPASNFEINLRSEQPLSVDRTSWVTTEIELADFSSEPRLRARLATDFTLGSNRGELTEADRDACLDANIAAYRNSDAIFRAIGRHMAVLIS